MDLSVIIVNYNVRHFLEQCLVSLFQALKNYRYEVFVIDNNSSDGSVSMIRSKFPDVNIIANKTNLGFGAANNQALKIAKGKYILFLNPDTVLPESTITTCLGFMESNPQAGATGIKMVDGKGRYLPESKRAVPTPQTAFYRIFNLNRIFPNSKSFNRYYLGHLSEDEMHEIEVLTGAFFFTRKEVLDKTGYFDEKFFMYGEDIDLSYRILKAGYKIYYLPDPSIIHYKGESTSKGTLNYVIHFYKAMMIFNRKHFSARRINLLTWLINIAILFRASLSYFRSVVNSLTLPAVDFILGMVSYLILADIWASYSISPDYEYPEALRFVILPLYLLIWIISISLFKGYHKPVDLIRSLKGMIAGTVLILVIYALLPADLRYSRALILIGSVMFSLELIFIRLISSLTGLIEVRGISKRERRTIIISKPGEYKRICDMIRKGEIPYIIIGRVSPGSNNDFDTLGNIENINEIIRINNIDEIVFSSSDLSAGEIIETMRKLSDSHVIKKIARTESEYLIGSNSSDMPGEIYPFTLRNIG